MAMPQTEALHEAAEGLDMRSDEEILAVLLDGQARAVAALQPALSDLAKAARLMARSVQSGARLIYAAAGSSGLMALADAAELGGTYGIKPAQVRILMAGGLPVDARMPGDTEDDSAEAAVAARDIRPEDTVITLSASGTTPYAVTIARIARQAGASVICIANNPGAPLFEHADVAICAATPPEVVSGSTRMGAGTAQKAALNMMSTLMGLRLGHVHDGMMVNLVADNEKLRARAAGMVARIANVADAPARDALARAEGAVKPAVLIAAGADQGKAVRLLAETEGHLRAALARV